MIEGVSTLDGALVRLRPTAEDDLDFVVRTEGDADNPSYVNVWPREQHGEKIDEPVTAHMIVAALDDGRPVGYVILNRWLYSYHSIELTRITMAEQGRGYGRDALRLVKRSAFEQLGLHRLALDTREDNARARRLYEAEGFVQEGIMRDVHLIDGRYTSLVLMSILEDEYQR